MNHKRAPFYYLFTLFSFLIPAILYSITNSAKYKFPVFTFAKPNQLEFINKPKCGETIKLKPFPKENPDKNRQVFYVETTYEPNIAGRLVCSMESAITTGQLPVKYFLRNDTLKLDNPSLCDAVDRFYPKMLEFYTASLEDLFSGTIMMDILKRNLHA